MSHTTIGDVLDFLNASRVFEHDVENRCLYRGQTQDWPLRPSAARHGWFGFFEKDVLEPWRQNAAPIIEFDNTDWREILCAAQHHGAPTRLLDWSTSPLVALWFAVLDGAKDTFEDCSIGGDLDAWKGLPEDPPDGYVYVSLPKRWLQENEDVFNINEIKQLNPVHRNRRVTAQQSVFTVHPLPIQLPEPRLFIKKIRIPGVLKGSIFKELDRLGINYLALMPDAEGLTHHYRWFSDNVRRSIKPRYDDMRDVSQTQKTR